MNNIRKMSALLGAGAVIFSLAGCADKDGGGQAEAPMDPNNVGGAVKDNLGDTANAVTGAAGAVGNAVSGAAGTVGNAVSGAAGTASNAASNAAGAAAQGANKMGGAIANAGEAATMTPAVKTALTNNAGLKGVGQGINVDTKGAKDSISLSGSVKSAAQKNLAAQVAQKAAPGYKIVNNLTVAGG